MSTNETAEQAATYAIAIMDRDRTIATLRAEVARLQSECDKAVNALVDVEAYLSTDATPEVMIEDIQGRVSLVLDELPKATP